MWNSFMKIRVRVYFLVKDLDIESQVLQINAFPNRNAASVRENSRELVAAGCGSIYIQLAEKCLHSDFLESNLCFYPIS